MSGHFVEEVWDKNFSFSKVSKNCSTQRLLCNISHPAPQLVGRLLSPLQRLTSRIECQLRLITYSMCVEPTWWRVGGRVENSEAFTPWKQKFSQAVGESTSHWLHCLYGGQLDLFKSTGSCRHSLSTLRVGYEYTCKVAKCDAVKIPSGLTESFQRCYCKWLHHNMCRAANEPVYTGDKKFMLQIQLHAGPEEGSRAVCKNNALFTTV